MDIESTIGLTAAPVLIPILVAHIKAFVGAVRPALASPGGVADGETEASAWPLVADFLGVLWALGLWAGDSLPAEVDNVVLTVMVGLALGLTGSALRDQVVRR